MHPITNFITNVRDSPHCPAVNYVESRYQLWSAYKLPMCSSLEGYFPSNYATLQLLQFKEDSSNHNKILHIPRQHSCLGMCKILLWLDMYERNYKQICFDFIQHLMEISGVRWALCLTEAANAITIRLAVAVIVVSQLMRKILGFPHNIKSITHRGLVMPHKIEST